MIVIFLCGKTTVIRMEGMSQNSHSFIHSFKHSFIQPTGNSSWDSFFSFIQHFINSLISLSHSSFPFLCLKFLSFVLPSLFTLFPCLFSIEFSHSSESPFLSSIFTHFSLSFLFSIPLFDIPLFCFAFSLHFLPLLCSHSFSFLLVYCWREAWETIVHYVTVVSCVVQLSVSPQTAVCLFLVCSLVILVLIVSKRVLLIGFVASGNTGLHCYSFSFLLLFSICLFIFSFFLFVPSFCRYYELYFYQAQEIVFDFSLAFCFPAAPLIWAAAWGVICFVCSNWTCGTCVAC